MKKVSTISSLVIDLYAKLIGTIPDLAMKGKTMPYTSVNGHMFSFLDKKNKLSLRMSYEAREAFLKKHPDCVSIQNNTVMKDYVLVPDVMMKDMKSLKKLMKDSYDHTGSLKPKPAKRKK